ncbi:MAG TPA: hypothetical protein VK661_09235 [Planctomycetota bacterium]|nr:hypothetical protein [Planctomycetota bacterium]
MNGKRWAVVASVVAVVVAAASVLAWPGRERGELPADVAGLWHMRETHADFAGCLRWTWLEIRQDGDRVEIRSWEDLDTWSCVGKGRVEGRKLLFQWWGADKRWRGTAALELKEAELIGTFQRLDVHAGEQYCRGERTRRGVDSAAKEPTAGGSR